MLTYFPPNTQPVAQALRNGATYNNDGHGYAIVTAKGKLVVFRSMDSDEAIDSFVKARAEHPEGPALFHSRMGTAGSYSMLNVHPFRIGGDRRTVLAHNGIFPWLVQPAKGDKRCDTRITAEDLLHGEDLGDPVYREELGKWMGKGNKVVILTVNPKYSHSAYIINEDSGVWDETGIWYSNRDYQSEYSAWDRHYGAAWRAENLKWSKKKGKNGKTTYTFGATLEEKCPYCTSSYLEDYSHCVDCDSCIDCAEAWDHCSCNEAAISAREERDEDDNERLERMTWWEDAERDATGSVETEGLFRSPSKDYDDEVAGALVRISEQG